MDRNKMKQLQKLGPFKLAQARRMGISHQQLSMLVKEEKILRMERGVYLHPQAKITDAIDFQIAYQKIGKESAIGGLSALFYYHLIDQVPRQTWVLVPPTKRTNSQGFRLVRTKTSLNHGIIEGDGYRIVSRERAIAEAFKLAPKIGERTAVHACRIAIQEKQTTIKKIGEAAKELGLASYFKKYFEVIIGALQ